MKLKHHYCKVVNYGGGGGGGGGGDGRLDFAILLKTDV